MSAPPPEIDFADMALAKLASLDLQAAQHAHQELLAATEPDDVAKLARAYTICARSARQTLALHARLKAQREKAALEASMRRAAAIGPEVEEAEIEALIDDLHTGMGRVIARASHGDRARQTELVHRFERELDDWTEAPDFLDYDADDIIRHACQRLGLPPPLAERWRDLPDPEWEPDPAVRAEPPPLESWPPAMDDEDEDDDAAPAVAATDSS